MKSFFKKLTHLLLLIYIMGRYRESPKRQIGHFSTIYERKKVDKMYGAVSRFSLVGRCSLIDFV